MTASERAAEINAATQKKWPDNCFLLTEDADHWKKAGVETGEQLDRYLLIEDYSDFFKEEMGFRDRHTNFDLLTTAQIQEKFDKLLSCRPNF